MKKGWVIFVIILFILLCIYYNSKKEGDISSIKYDALNIIMDAETQHILGALDDENYNVTCYYIYGYENGMYSNAANYVGSVLYKENGESIIWLSDGNYLIQGTSDSITIKKSNETATTTCNR